MATTAILTRLLPPAAYGEYGLALVVMSFGSMVFLDWLGAAFARLYEGGKDDPRTLSTFVQLYTMIVVLTVFCGLIVWSLVRAVGLDVSVDEAAPYLIGLCLMWVYGWFELAARFEVARFRPGIYMRMSMARAAFILAGTCTAAWVTGDPLWAAAGYGLGMLAASAFGRTSGWSVDPRRFDLNMAASVVRYGVPLGVAMALGAVAMNGTRWLVAPLASTEALGVYTAAFVVVQNTLGVIAYGVVSAGYQLAVRAMESGDDGAARRQLVSNATLVLGATAPASLGMALTAPGLARLIVGPAFVEPVIQLMPWMAAAQFLMSIRACYLDHAFQLGRKPHLQIAILGTAAVISVGLGVVLIPMLGPKGAAIAMTVAMGVSCGHAIWLGPRAYPLPMPYGAFARIALACLAMAAVVLLCAGPGIGALAAQVVLGGATYMAAAVATDLMGARSRLQALSRVWTGRRAATGVPRGP